MLNDASVNLRFSKHKCTRGCIGSYQPSRMGAIYLRIPPENATAAETRGAACQRAAGKSVSVPLMTSAPLRSASRSWRAVHACRLFSRCVWEDTSPPPARPALAGHRPGFCPFFSIVTTREFVTTLKYEALTQFVWLLKYSKGINRGGGGVPHEHVVTEPPTLQRESLRKC